VRWRPHQGMNPPVGLIIHAMQLFERQARRSSRLLRDTPPAVDGGTARRGSIKIIK
jgi:hypothetical protein